MKHMINGCELNIEAPDDGGYVTDVMVLARVVRPGGDGRMGDAIIVSATPQTTGIIQAGMITVANNVINDWGDDE